MSDSQTSDTPAFLTLTAAVPQPLRDLLDEADGCLHSRFLTGGTSCARRALDVLLVAASAEGETYEDRVKSLRERHAVSQMLTTILIQCAGATERDGAKLNATVLEAFLGTIKAVVYELYVLGPERNQRLQYVHRLMERLDRPGANPPAGGELSATGEDPSQPADGGDSNHGTAGAGRRRPPVAVLTRS